MKMRPPTWLPWLGPVLAAGAGALAGEYWLGGDQDHPETAALLCGFAPIVGYQVWKRLHHRG